MSSTRVPREVIDALSRHERFLIIGHEEPDGDCVGSQLALARFLSRLGKQTQLYSPGPFKRPEVLRYASRFAGSVAQKDTDGDTAVVVVDCSTLARIGSLAEAVDHLPSIVIDHHASGKPFGDTRYIEPSAPSVTYLIQRIIEAMGHAPDAEEAQLILFGLCTDTGFFRHLSRGSAPVFQSVARLVDAGADPNRAHFMMHGGRTLDSRILLGRLLARAVPHFDGKVITTYETYEDVQEIGPESRDSDALYQTLQVVSGCRVVALVRQETRDECTVGLRSNDELDVGTIARSFGGGGHPKAAGFRSRGSVDQVTRLVMEMLRREL
jgi:bifunctional oligoribonuclease and PAP phosphatase NrnA